jgi:hypothetical protein
MSQLVLRSAALLFGLFGLMGVGLAADLPASTDRGKELLAEGDKLADNKEPNEAVLKYKEAFEQLLPGLRKLNFKHEVKRDVTNREDMKAVLLKEIDEEMTPAEFRTGELGMKVLGFIPREMNWKEVMVKVYSEEIAAFYDPKTKTMHLIKEAPVVEKKKKGFFEALLGGKKDGFDKDENKTVIAHELTHALSDQNYDLDKMQKLVEGDDDRSMALSSLIEGEATLAMLGAQQGDWEGSKIASTPYADLDRIFSLMMPFMSFGGGRALREAPVILSESLIFPYFRGMVFCASLTNKGGWKSINEAYENPPQSTEQIMHPEKYLDQPDPPTAIDLGRLEPGEGWAEVGRNVVGEMQLAVLLRRHGGKPIAAGWDGDRFAVFDSKDGKLAVVWLTTWDTDDDARDFARQYTRFQTTKLGEGAVSPEEFPDAIRRPAEGVIYAVERRGKDVAVVEGFAGEATDRLLEAAFKAGKKEMEPIRRK